MGITITDDTMSSDLSPHSAGLWPMPGADESPAMWRGFLRIPQRQRELGE